MITLEEVEEKDFKEYVEELKDMGFDNNIMEVADGEARGFYANYDEEINVGVTYSVGNKTLNISIQLNV